MSKLYELSADFEQLFDMLDDESTEDIQQAIFDTVEGIEMEFNAKAENIACWIKQLSIEMDAIKAEKQSLEKRMKNKSDKINSLKSYLLANMEVMKLKKIDMPRAVISVRNNPESVEITNEDLLIEWAQKQTNSDTLLKYEKPKLVKSGFKELLQAGQVIENVKIVRKQGIMIK